MHDTLAYFQQEPIHRRWHHHELTFSLVYAFTENFILPLSHDEVVHGKGSMLSKMPGDRWQQLANLRALYAFMWAHPGKKLLFMGNELAQEQEWSEERSLDWHLLENPGHSGMQSLVRDLNHAYRDTPALCERDYDHTAFWWLEPNDAEGSVFAFARIGQRRAQAARVRRQPHAGAAHGLPDRPAGARPLAELVNTDSVVLRRLGPGQPRRRGGRGRAVDGPVHSAEVTLPPLGGAVARAATSRPRIRTRAAAWPGGAGRRRSDAARQPRACAPTSLAATTIDAEAPRAARCVGLEAVASSGSASIACERAGAPTALASRPSACGAAGSRGPRAGPG